MGLRNEYVSTMIYEELANGIIECVGGTENIASAINCMTRVRIRVNRDAAVRDDDLRALDGVLSVTHNQQGYLEVVVGPGKSRKCIDVFRTLGIPSAVPESQPVSEKPEEAIKPKAGVQFRLKAVLKTFGQIFAPLIPGVIAAGICAGVASLISQAVPGYTENKALSVAYSLLTGINAAFMAYLTGWAGYRTAEVFGGTPILGGMVGMFTTLESVNTLSAIVGLYNEAQPLNAILRSGRGGVLAAVVGVWLMCKIEAAIRRRIPDALDVVISPILTLFATLVPYVFVVMPATGLVSMGMCRVVGAIAVSPNPFVRMVSGRAAVPSHGCHRHAPWPDRAVYRATRNIWICNALSGAGNGGRRPGRRGAGHRLQGKANWEYANMQNHQWRASGCRAWRGRTADLWRNAARGQALYYRRDWRRIRRSLRYADGGCLHYLGPLRHSGGIRDD